MLSSLSQQFIDLIKDKNVNNLSIFLDNHALNINWDERDEEGQTFLMLACQQPDSEIVQLILKYHEGDINAIDEDNWSALLNAAKIGCSETIKLLLDADAFIEHRDRADWTALMWACYKGCTEAVKILLARKANPNAKGEHHMSCLSWAAGRGYSEIVHELLLYDAKVNTADKYGTTPLIWACRKGHTDAVSMLLNAGSLVDQTGMNSITALIAASAGGYVSIVRMLLDQHVNVNTTDKDGFTALTWAAKEGSIEIVNMLINGGAYVNLPDKYGDTILIHSVKNNHIEIVRNLLKKHADVDVQGVDSRTALYWAVEKGHTAIVKLLIEANANLETSNKDGDTALLKAIRCRNFDIVQLLLDKGAKVSTKDKKGNNALHLAVRGRSKRVTEYLLRNPKNAKLLYCVNKEGVTAYEIDATNERSVLTQVFGARNLNADDNIQGYELYSSTIADVLSEPSLRTPITVGLFARWGSGKSHLINRLRDEMASFTETYVSRSFQFSIIQGCISLFICIVAGVIFGATLKWQIGLIVGVGLFVLLYLFYVLIWIGTTRHEWSVACSISLYMMKKLDFLKLLLKMLFCNSPVQKNRDTAAIKFIFTDNARLNTLMGERSIIGIVSTLCDAVEHEYGAFVARLYQIFRPKKAAQFGSFKTLCCIPYFVFVILILICCISTSILFAIFGFDKSFSYEKRADVTNGVIIALLIIIAIAILGHAYTWCRVVKSLMIPMRQQIRKVAKQTDGIRPEAYIPLLKKEIESIGSMTRCMDAFTGNHSRLVVIVDGLDSCEQDKLLLVLDMVHVLFGDTESPFVTILAVDPQVIIKGIEHHMNALHDSNINGLDYLRGIIQLPVYIQNQVLPKPPVRNITKNEILEPPSSQLTVCHRQESSFSAASFLSLTDVGKSKGNRRNRLSTAHNFGSQTMLRQTSFYDLSKSLGKNSYFSDINPRNMKRLMNILAVTGRLLRAQNIEFNWYKLASWINLTEQWPYRLSWIILEIEDNDDIDELQTLKNVYDRISERLPSSRDIDPLMDIDRNVRKLEIFLANISPPLTVSELKRFLPSTINIDPYLRKLIRDLQQVSDDNPMSNGRVSRPSPKLYGLHKNKESFGSPRSTPQYSLHPTSSAIYNPYMTPMLYDLNIFDSNTGQSKKRKTFVKIDGGLGSKVLSHLKVEEIINLMSRIECMDHAHFEEYSQKLKSHNINGLVLSTCNLIELRPILMMTFGDWEIFRSLIEQMRDNEESFEDIVERDKSEEKNGDVSTSKVKLHRPVSIHSNHVKQMKSEGISNKTNANFEANSQNSRRSSIELQHSSADLKSKKMCRQDSFVNEVIAETQALKGFIDASMDYNSSDDDVDNDGKQTRTGNISPIPEEDSNTIVASPDDHFSHISSYGSFKIGCLSRKSSLDVDPPLVKKTNEAFLAGPDNDSGESDIDEIDRLSSKSKQILLNNSVSSKSVKLLTKKPVSVKSNTYQEPKHYKFGEFSSSSDIKPLLEQSSESFTKFKAFSSTNSNSFIADEDKIYEIGTTSQNLTPTVILSEENSKKPKVLLFMGDESPDIGPAQQGDSTLNMQESVTIFMPSVYDNDINTKVMFSCGSDDNIV